MVQFGDSMGSPRCRGQLGELVVWGQLGEPIVWGQLGEPVVQGQLGEPAVQGTTWDLFRFLFQGVYL